MFLNTFLAQSHVPNDFLGSQHENCGTPVPSNDNDGASSSEEHDEPELQPPPSTQVPRPPPSESGSSSASIPFSPRTQRTIKTFADRTCRDLNLPDGSLETFSSVRFEFPSLMELSWWASVASQYVVYARPFHGCFNKVQSSSTNGSC